MTWRLDRPPSLRPNTSPVQQLLLTKGDNNPTDDVNFYDGKDMWLKNDMVVGKVQGYVLDMLLRRKGDGRHAGGHSAQSSLTCLLVACHRFLPYIGESWPGILIL